MTDFLNKDFFKRVNPQLGFFSKVIPLKLFLDIVPSLSPDITSALRGCLHGGSFYVTSFCFKAKENLQCCGDVFWNILLKSKGASVLGMLLLKY